VLAQLPITDSNDPEGPKLLLNIRHEARPKP